MLNLGKAGIWGVDRGHIDLSLGLIRLLDLSGRGGGLGGGSSGSCRVVAVTVLDDRGADASNQDCVDGNNEGADDEGLLAPAEPLHGGGLLGGLIEIDVVLIVRDLVVV